MSFSKARIQRFNELGSEAPPPGAYDPKFDNKVKGLAIEKTERFQDTKSVSSGGATGAECMSVSSKGAGSTSGQSGSARKFKTPPVPRKRVIVKPAIMSCPRAKSKPLIASKDPKSQYDLQNELADLRVECSNKDRTILDQEKHIEEMKGEISAITKRLNELSTKCSADEEQHKKDIESMATLQQEVLDSQKEKHNVELDFLRNQLVDLTNLKKEEILELNRREHELKEEILTLRRKETELNQRIAMLESNFSNNQGVEDLAMNLKKAEERLNELSTEMFEIIESKDRDLENLMEARAEVEEELSVVQEEYHLSQEKISELQRNLENLSESLDSRLTSAKSKIISEIVDFLQCTLNSLNPEEENSIFFAENRKLGETIKKVREDFKILVNQELEDFKSKFEALEKENQEVKLMRLELESKLKESAETIDFLTEELRDVQRHYQDASLGLQKAKAKLETTEERLAQAEEAHKAEHGSLSKLHEEEQSKLKNLMEETRLEYLQQLENMSEARNQELEEVKEAAEKMIEEEKKRIKEHADKLVENAEAVTRETLAACRAESEERVKRVIAETDGKLSSIVREVKKTAEEEVRLANERFSTSSKRFEAEKSSLEEKLTEKDSEISQLRTALDELKSTAETQESFSQSLQAELDRAEAELVEKKEELRNLKDHIRSEAAEMVARRRRFEVVMSENQASVCALTNRIAESDEEVKRLQRELENSESSLREHRDLLSSMQSNSKVLQEQVHAITDQLKIKESLIDQLEENCKIEIESIKSALESKIENVMETTAIRVSRLQEDCLNKSKMNAELKQLLDEMASKWNEVQSTLLSLEEQSDEQLIEISTLQTINAKLELNLKNQTTLVYESKARENEIEEAKAQINDLRIKVETLEAKNLGMKEEMLQSEEQRQNWKTVQHSLMEDLERERAGREKTEREMKVLADNFERFRGEYEELTEKYTEVLGHHNHNQRIKHISKLKDKILTQQKDNLRLKQELESKTNLLEQLTKNSERAKLEEKRKVGKGKENISSSYGKATPVQKVRTNSISLSKSASTTPTASPNKTLTPLRNRNE